MQVAHAQDIAFQASTVIAQQAERCLFCRTHSSSMLVSLIVMESWILFVPQKMFLFTRVPFTECFPLLGPTFHMSFYCMKNRTGQKWFVKHGSLGSDYCFNLKYAPGSMSTVIFYYNSIYVPLQQSGYANDEGLHSQQLMISSIAHHVVFQRLISMKQLCTKHTGNTGSDDDFCTWTSSTHDPCQTRKTYLTSQRESGSRGYRVLVLPVLQLL